MPVFDPGEGSVFRDAGGIFGALARVAPSALDAYQRAQQLALQRRRVAAEEERVRQGGVALGLQESAQEFDQFWTLYTADPQLQRALPPEMKARLGENIRDMTPEERARRLEVGAAVARFSSEFDLEPGDLNRLVDPETNEIDFEYASGLRAVAEPVRLARQLASAPNSPFESETDALNHVLGYPAETRELMISRKNFMDAQARYQERLRDSVGLDKGKNKGLDPQARLSINDALDHYRDALAAPESIKQVSRDTWSWFDEPVDKQRLVQALVASNPEQTNIDSIMDEVRGVIALETAPDLVQRAQVDVPEEDRVEGGPRTRPGPIILDRLREVDKHLEVTFWPAEGEDKGTTFSGTDAVRALARVVQAGRLSAARTRTSIGLAAQADPRAVANMLVEQSHLFGPVLDGLSLGTLATRLREGVERGLPPEQALTRAFEPDSEELSGATGRVKDLGAFIQEYRAQYGPFEEEEPTFFQTEADRRREQRLIHEAERAYGIK